MKTIEELAREYAATSSLVCNGAVRDAFTAGHLASHPVPTTETPVEEGTYWMKQSGGEWIARDLVEYGSHLFEERSCRVVTEFLPGTLWCKALPPTEPAPSVTGKE